jgi:hypothetical protein
MQVALSLMTAAVPALLAFPRHSAQQVPMLLRWQESKGGWGDRPFGPAPCGLTTDG